MMRMNGPASHMANKQQASTSSAQVNMSRNCNGCSVTGIGPNQSSIVVSAPGPAMNGNASGKTEMSARRLLSTFSSLEVRVPDSRANTISSAMRKSNNPPKILNESMAMPIAARNPAPTSAKSRSIPLATNTDFRAILCRQYELAPSVRPENTGISEIGSTTTKNTMKNLTACSSMMLCATNSFLYLTPFGSNMKLTQGKAKTA